MAKEIKTVKTKKEAPALVPKAELEAKLKEKGLKVVK